MVKRFIYLVALMALPSAVLQSQTPQTVAKPHANNIKPAPRAADGKPDLSGVWGVVDRAPGIDTTAREESVFLEKLYGRLTNERPARTQWAEELSLIHI